MTGRSSYPNPEAAPALPIFDRLLPAPPQALVDRPDRGALGRRRRRRRPVRAWRLGRPRRARPAAPGHLPRIEPADADAGRGRPAAARRPPPRRRVPGHGRLAAARVEPQGLARRPVRDALPDVRPDARRRGVHLGRRRARARGGRPGLPLHGLSRPARRDEIRQAPLDAEDLVRARGGRRGGRGPRDHQGPVPGRGRRAEPRRRAARPAHAAPARGAGRDHRPDRDGPARGPGPRRAPAGLPPLDPAVEPADDGARAGPATCTSRTGT